jgi:hypothetical protein
MLKNAKEGEWEKKLMEKIKAGDHAWVADLLQKTGKDVLLSPWAGGMTKTAVIYAAEKKDLEMCKAQKAPYPVGFGFF